MIASLLPTDVVVAVATEPDYEAPLHPAEEAAIRGAVAVRRREFAAGRACARRALVHIYSEALPIPRGAHGQPLWPAGVVGSITHTAGYCAAAVARRADYRSIGIDAQERVIVDPDTLRMFATERERSTGFAVDGEPAALLWFSAKEAFYKAWSAAGGRWLGYLDVEVVIAPEGRCFEVGLADGGRLPIRAQGRFEITPSHVLAAITVRDSLCSQFWRRGPRTPRFRA